MMSVVSPTNGPLTVDLYVVSGPFVGETTDIIGAHQKRASGDPDHARRRLPVSLPTGRRTRVRGSRIRVSYGSAGDQQYGSNPKKTAKQQCELSAFRNPACSATREGPSFDPRDMHR